MEIHTREPDILPDHEELQFGEECGVVAVVGNQASVRTRRGLAALQHRGQESAGISSLTPDGILLPYTGMGLVPHVLTDEVMERLGETRASIGHVRYGTSSKSVPENAQPITMEHAGHALSNATNGNLINTEWLRQNTSLQSEATSDTGLQTAYLLERRPLYSSWEETLRNELPRIQGAYANVMMTEDGTVYGFRGEHGIRPLCLGRFGDTEWALASETVALDLMGIEFVRDVAPGEIVSITPDGLLNSSFFGEPRREQPCVFEQIYFARPDSFARGQRMRTVRENAGKQLARRIQQKGIQVDAVVPIFDSGYPAAKGTAQELDVPTVEAITTSHYVGRTFIQPGHDNRVSSINGKHNVVPDELIGKEIVDVDDSIVRSNTGKRITAMERSAGARRIHKGSASPPIVDTCDLGVDMPHHDDLPAAAWRNEGHDAIERKMSGLMGADSVTFLTVDDLAEAVGEHREDFCHHCLGGKHPIRSEQERFPQKERPLNGSPRVHLFASGSGTNVQEILDRVYGGDIDAKISGIISNKPDSYVLERARAHDVPSEVFPSKGILRDPDKRHAYNREIEQYIKGDPPDALVMAGWMIIMDDDFLRTMQELEIPVLNLHPGLLTEDHSGTVMTSRGRIPVLRGMHTIADAYNTDLPVSGVTIHQLLPNVPFDTGPVIYKEEVRRHSQDTPESWEARMHEAEYRALPTGLKRVLHVMKHNVDVSKGTFPW